MELAMTTDPIVARQVMHAVRRLVVKQGKILSLFTWIRVNKLLRAAVALCGEDVETAAVIKTDLHVILSIVESLIDRGEFKGSPDEFFELIEDCVIDRPDSSAMRLIDYRIACLTPEKDKWIEQIHRILTKYLYDGVSLVRREKAVYVMENILKTHRVLHEAALLRKVILPICSGVVQEREPSIQYFLLHVLFEVAKTTTINPNGTNELFMSVLSVIGSAFNGGINLGNDNLEVAACGINELLDERWTVFDLRMVETIFTIVVKHLELHYVKMCAMTSGCDVRMRLFESLLLIASHPLNGQMARVLIRSPTQFEPIYNPRIVRAGEDTNGKFRWTSICAVCTLGLESEKYWPALERILEFLSGALEHRMLVRTAGSEKVDCLAAAVLGIVNKAEQRFPFVPRTKLARYLCPVLGKLVNYTQESQICRIIVQLTRTGCPQAIMAADTAIQVLPDKMAVFNRSLLESLVSLKPCAQLALPIVELLNDMADVPNFWSFFQNKQFKGVINVLAPYSNARQYNSFVVTSVFQTAMRWYLCVPLSDRGIIAAHMFGSFANANGLLPTPAARLTESPEPPDFALSLVSNGEGGNSLGELTVENADAHPTALIITPAKKRTYGHKKSTTALALNRDPFVETSADSPPTHERHPSGDGRQPIEYPFEEPLPLFSTGDTVSIGMDASDSEFNFKGVNELAHQILSQEYAAQQEAKQTRPSRETLAATLAIESLENLNYFVRFFRTRLIENCALSSCAAFSTIFEEDVVPMSPTADQMLDELVEQRVENWVVDGSVLTMRVLVKREIASFGLHSRRVATISVDRPSTANSMTSDAGTKASRAAQAIAAANNAGNRLNRSMSRGKQSTPPVTSNSRRQPRISTTSTDSDENRRRHKSAREVSSASPKKSLQTTTADPNGLQSPPLHSGRATPNTPDSDEIFKGEPAVRGDLLDDLSPSKNYRPSECVQLIIRHVFGREAYQISPEFGGTCSIRPSDPASLMMHLRGNRSAVHLATRDVDLIRRSLDFLDRMPTIEEHHVGVLYIRDSKFSLSDVLATEYGSDRFAEFIRRLGSVVPVQSGKENVYTYVHSDLQTRLCFEVATLMPNTLDDPNSERKRKILEAAPVCVIFNESGSPLFASPNPLNDFIRQAEQVVFEVLPQDDSTVLINVHSRREVACWLALSRVLLPDERAIHVLRKLAIRAQRAFNVWCSLSNESSADGLPFVSMSVSRQRHIHKLRKRGKAEPF